MAFLAWPGVVLILGVISIIAFRANIGRFLDRTKSVGKDGLKAYDEQQQQQLQAAPAKPDALTAFLEGYHSPLLLETETAIEEEIKTRGLTTLADANKALVKSLAGVLIQSQFEKIENVIWASQVKSLVFLNGRTGLATPSEKLEPSFAEAAANYPRMYDDLEFSDWLRFLTTQGLVIVNVDGLAITVRGREYLKWRVDQGKPGPFWG